VKTSTAASTARHRATQPQLEKEIEPQVRREFNYGSRRLLIEVPPLRDARRHSAARQTTS